MARPSTITGRPGPHRSQHPPHSHCVSTSRWYLWRSPLLLLLLMASTSSGRKPIGRLMGNLEQPFHQVQSYGTSSATCQFRSSSTVAVKTKVTNTNRCGNTLLHNLRCLKQTITLSTVSLTVIVRPVVLPDSLLSSLVQSVVPDEVAVDHRSYNQSYHSRPALGYYLRCTVSRTNTK